LLGRCGLNWDLCRVRLGGIFLPCSISFALAQNDAAPVLIPCRLRYRDDLRAGDVGAGKALDKAGAPRRAEQAGIVFDPFDLAGETPGERPMRESCRPRRPAMFALAKCRDVLELESGRSNFFETWRAKLGTGLVLLRLIQAALGRYMRSFTLHLTLLARFRLGASQHGYCRTREKAWPRQFGFAHLCHLVGDLYDRLGALALSRSARGFKSSGQAIERCE